MFNADEQTMIDKSTQIIDALRVMIEHSGLAPESVGMMLVAAVDGWVTGALQGGDIVTASNTIRLIVGAMGSWAEDLERLHAEVDGGGSGVDGANWRPQ